MQESGLSNIGAHASAAPVGCAIELTEQGLVYAGGSVLIRMRKSADGRPELAVGVDRARMLAMLSIAFGRSAAALEVIPHVETAAEHWRRGEKALANLRLVFAGLTGPSDPAAGHRVALAARLLDQGWPPAALLEELGLADGLAGFAKYNPNHVPAGHGDRSGQFDFRSGTSSTADGRIVVAEDDNENEHQIRVIAGQTSLKEDENFHQLIPRDQPIPFFGGAVFGPKETLSAAAAAAAAKVGPGKGPVYGTKVHTEMKEQVKALNRPDLHCEQSYLNGVCVKYGTPGSIRVDVAHPTAEKPHTVYDLKTGGATLDDVRKEHFRVHLPKRDDGKEVEIHEIRP